MGATTMLQSINGGRGWTPDPEDPDVARFRAERERRAARERVQRLEGRARVVLLEVGSFPKREELVAAAEAHYGAGKKVGLSRVAVLRIAALALRIRSREQVRRLDPAAEQVVRPEWDPEAKPRREKAAPAEEEFEVEAEDLGPDRVGGDVEPEVENQTMATETAPPAETTATRPLNGKEDEERVREYLRGLLADDRRLVEDRGELRDKVRERLHLEVHPRTFRRLVDEAYALATRFDPGAAAGGPAMPEADAAGSAGEHDTAEPVPSAAVEAGQAPVQYPLPPNRLLGLAATNGHAPKAPAAEPPYQALQYGITSTGEAHLAIEVTVPVHVALRLMREFAAAMADEVMSSAGGAR